MNWRRWNWLYRFFTGYNHPSVTAEAFRSAHEDVRKIQEEIWGPGGPIAYFAEQERKMNTILRGEKP